MKNIFGDLMNTFSQILKKLRVEQKLSQIELSKKLNVSTKSISHWETGYTEPSITQLIQLADIFDISLDELTGRN